MLDVVVLIVLLAVLLLVSTTLLVVGLVRRARLHREIERARVIVPRDRATGLYSREVCLPRLDAEMKRARRTGGSVWVVVVTVVAGDPDRLGRLLADSLRVQELGFRIGDRVMCIVCPGADPDARADVIGRVHAAGPREQIVLGDAIWRGPHDGDAASVLAAAASTRLAAPA